MHWIDADGDGCDTRGEVLIAESTTPPARATGCSIAGAWTSSYDETVTTDASSLVAVTASTNRSKADQDPSSWLPPADARCRYTSEWVQTRYRWHLAVDPVERDALAAQSAGCGNPGVDVPARADVPDPGTTPTPTPAPDPGPALATGSSMSAGQQLAGGTWRQGRACLDVQDDGNAVLYSGNGYPAWYSAYDTGRAATSASRGTPLTPVAPQPPRPARRRARRRQGPPVPRPARLPLRAGPRR